MAACAVLGWSLWDWTLRRERTEQAVLQALDEAKRLQEQDKVPEALSAIRRAEGMAPGGFASERVRQQLQKRRTDLELLSDLEQVWLKFIGVMPALAFLTKMVIL